jgi:hypothetical protein
MGDSSSESIFPVIVLEDSANETTFHIVICIIVTIGFLFAVTAEPETCLRSCCCLVLASTLGVFMLGLK